MPTTLTKPVRRRIGELVVTLQADGLLVRRFRKRRAVRIPWEILDDLLATPRCRQAAFQRPAPRGWCPRPGERVFVRPIAGTLCRCVSSGLVVAVITAVPQPIVKVRLRHNYNTTYEQLDLCNTRPIGPQGLFSEEAPG